MVIPKLTLHQNNIIHNLLNCSDKIVLLTGGPGTGKSFTISQFIQTIQHQGNFVGITATSHKAAANLTDMIGIQATTIHKFLGMRLVDTYGTAPYLTAVKNAKVEAVDYLIIDEVSMLTKPLIERLDEYIKAFNPTKVILVGDAIQLRLPGSIDISSFPMFELTEQMRQLNTPNVSTTLQTIRESIQNKTVLPKLTNQGKDLIIYTNHNDFLKAYKHSDFNDRVFITYQNRTVKSYNDNVKLYIYEDEEKYSKGDIIYPTSPIIEKVRHDKGFSNITTITNRELCTILKVQKNLTKDGDIFSYKLTTDKGIIKVPKVKTQFFEGLEVLAQRKDWVTFYGLKNTHSAVHHTFAGTSHSLQGTSFDEVFIDYTDIAKIADYGSIDDLKRALYVAISRCKHKCHIFVGDTRNYKALGKYTPRKNNESMD